MESSPNSAVLKKGMKIFWDTAWLSLLCASACLCLLSAAAVCCLSLCRLSSAEGIIVDWLDAARRDAKRNNHNNHSELTCTWILSRPKGPLKESNKMYRRYRYMYVSKKVSVEQKEEKEKRKWSSLSPVRAVFSLAETSSGRWTRL